VDRTAPQVISKLTESLDKKILEIENKMMKFFAKIEIAVPGGQITQLQQIKVELNTSVDRRMLVHCGSYSLPTCAPPASCRR
jgi:hypothetical protein